MALPGDLRKILREVSYEVIDHTIAPNEVYGLPSGGEHIWKEFDVYGEAHIWGVLNVKKMVIRAGGRVVQYPNSEVRVYS